ncbi:Cell wall protein phiA [Cladobotryum mycophilum]|uniref:Cell wall protein phiA n=1 Tax=Cladobotryum mycophilum TaxID=491253 RepID=A0ABR0SLK9_9HYPO
MALRAKSPIDSSRFSAARRSLFVNLKDQNATCQGKSDGYASFYIQDEQLFLYTSKAEKQQVFTDRSGMGMYFNFFLVRGIELKGWKINDAGELVFKDASMIACPNSINGAWSIWLAVGIAQPGGNKDCLPFTARTLPYGSCGTPVTCCYTQ